MLPSLGSGVTRLNIALVIPAMTMSRHIIFAVIGILSNPSLRKEND